MANKKNKRHTRNPLESLIQRKARAFLEAERTYWKHLQTWQQQFRQTEQALELGLADSLPENISSIVWGLTDGVAFVHYKSIGKSSDVQFRILPISLEDWGETGLIVPLEQGEISLARSGLFKGFGNFSLVNCAFNDVEIPYAEFAHLKYGDTSNIPSIERAILDFQITLLGIQIQKAGHPNGSLSPENTLVHLSKISQELESLIETADKEEELQLFLKQYPFVLHPSAEIIPKKKLGEDFITDFVLVAITAQGPTYILVELERPSYPVLTKEMMLSSQVSHAIKQTRDWDVWLEKNKAYIQNKLPGFESPRYLIVIGRADQLNEEQKAYLRSYNREWKTTELLTYDDVLKRFQNTITRLNETVNAKGSVEKHGINKSS